MASLNPNTPSTSEPSAFPPSQDQLQAAFKSALSTLGQPEVIIEWCQYTLVIFKAMVDTLEGIHKPLTSKSSNRGPQFQSFFSNLMKWSECSLQTALDILMGLQNRPSQLEPGNLPLWLSDFHELRTQFESFQTTLQTHIPSPSPTQEPEFRMSPLIRHFIEMIFADTTMFSTSEIERTWTGFLNKIDIQWETSSHILPCCFFICYCNSQEGPAQLRRFVVGTSAEKWLRGKTASLPEAAREKSKKAVTALNNMIKDVRFHWVLDTYHRQHNGSVSRAESREHILKIKAQGTRDKELVPSGGPDTETHSAINMATEYMEPQICSEFLNHRAYIVDVKSGQPKPRCAKCRVRFIRDFDQNQLEIESQQKQERAFRGLSCAEDVGVILCRD